MPAETCDICIILCGMVPLDVCVLDCDIVSPLILFDMYMCAKCAHGLVSVFMVITCYQPCMSGCCCDHSHTAVLSDTAADTHVPVTA